MSVAHHDRLLSIVRAVANNRGYACHLTDRDVVTLSGATTFTVPLGVVRQQAADRPEHQWPALVAAHIDHRAVAGARERETPRGRIDFATVRGLLRTRLYSTESAGVDVVRRIVAPGIIQRILIDRGDTVAPVTYDLLRQWRIGEFELFALAEHNVRAAAGVTVHRDESGEPVAEDLPPMSMLTGPDYLTAHVRWLGEYAVVGPGGAVLTMPSQQSVYAYPVAGAEVVSAVTALAQVAVTAYAEEPGPINPWVYWWRDGQLDLAATTSGDDDHVSIYPTGRFRRFVESMGGELLAVDE
ncbi:hypothetical protein [Nocardia sp. BMG51109]|uniref:hypothetical protein n=1 Tax=Nocardia sp. BMG51109 TaxID=1056816 RepID=UPI0004670CED|nr:hypothetical protein [Nocardia sp. BMG51109]